MMLINIFLAEGFEEIEAATPYDLLKRAGHDVKFVSVTGEQVVTAAHGARYAADLLYDEAEFAGCGMLVLPGGLPGAENLMNHQDLVRHVEEFLADGRIVAAICASPAFVLGRNGLLAGRKATCFPGCEGDMKGAEVSGETVVVDGNLITSQGPATAMEFGLALVEVVSGTDARAKMEKALLYRA